MVFFCTGFMASSIGMVTNFSTSSALLPGHCVMMVTLVLVMSGKASTGVFSKQYTPNITTSKVRNKIKNLFRRENVMILLIKFFIRQMGYFSELYTSNAL